MAQGAPHGARAPLPSCIGSPDIPESGWDRLRELFQPNEQGRYPEEVKNIGKSALSGALLGWVYGGVPAARHSRERYIQQNQAEVYQNRVDAVRSAHNAALRGFIRYGWRWSWRVTAFVTVFNSVSTGLSVYRDKVVLSHFAAAGAVTGGLFRFSLGLGGLLSGSLLGAMLGIPAGAIISGLQSLSGESIHQKKHRERRELYENKVQEWNDRMQVTEGVLHEMEASRSAPAEHHVKRIHDLLQQHKNLNDNSEEGR